MSSRSVRWMRRALGAVMVCGAAVACGGEGAIDGAEEDRSKQGQRGGDAPWLGGGDDGCDALPAASEFFWVAPDQGESAFWPTGMLSFQDQLIAFDAERVLRIDPAAPSLQPLFQSPADATGAIRVHAAGESLVIQVRERLWRLDALDAAPRELPALQVAKPYATYHDAAIDGQTLFVLRDGEKRHTVTVDAYDLRTGVTSVAAADVALLPSDDSVHQARLVLDADSFYLSCPEPTTLARKSMPNVVKVSRANGAAQRLALGDRSGSVHVIAVRDGRLHMAYDAGYTSAQWALAPREGGPLQRLALGTLADEMNANLAFEADATYARIASSLYRLAPGQETAQILRCYPYRGSSGAGLARAGEHLYTWLRSGSTRGLMRVPTTP